MKKEKYSAHNFIGKVFMPNQIDENKTYTTAIQEMENDPVFQKFIKDNGYENERASLVVFGPENFMFWYGILADDKQMPVAGLNKFELPASEIAGIDTPDSNLAFFSQPLNFVIPTFLDKLSKDGITMYENLGDSEKPYVLAKLNLETKELAQILYLDASSEESSK
ncbi:hypothetical protein K1B48_00755 [Lactobacillus johnsonii]|uniref:hypothetical protein n=1 Tax=Lactobacillus johnsonii TaxID=33959 RepID=UPI001C68A917|nr:hypothetical protein [Lactobacillus johnsonii]MBW8459768.1 hypothetical protein [Lactobacillus johnsonii]